MTTEEQKVFENILTLLDSPENWRVSRNRSVRHKCINLWICSTYSCRREGEWFIIFPGFDLTLNKEEKQKISSKVTPIFIKYEKDLLESKKNKSLKEIEDFLNKSRK